jgi:hypothetical protein
MEGLNYRVDWDKYEIIYNEPIHLIVHPHIDYYVKNKLNSFGLKYIKYRTKCPRTKLELCDMIEDNGSADIRFRKLY